MSESLRQLVASAVSASNTMSSVESADTLAYMMSSLMTAHHDTCQYTSDKVVLGKFKYDVLMSNKPQVYTYTSLIFFSVEPNKVAQFIT